MTNLNEKILELAAPEIPDALANFPGSQDNLLPLSALQSPLRVLIARWLDPGPAPGLPVRLTLLLNGNPVANYDFTTPIDPALFPFPAHIPEQNLQQEGEHEVSYRVIIGGNAGQSTGTPITIDTTAPNYGNPGAAPVFPPDVISHGITQKYLDDHGDEVLVTIPQYLQQRTCDRIEFYFGSLTAPPAIITTVHDSSSPTVIKLSGEIIRAHGSGNKLAFCRLSDRAGNIGSLSAFVSVDVHLP
ncbi:hypothetical protein [Pseudomonas sp. SDO52101_S400]